MSAGRGAPRVEPFPFRLLEGLTRAEVAAARRLRRVASRAINLGKLSKELENILQVPVRARLKTVRQATAASLAALPGQAGGSVGVLLAPADRARARDGARVLVIAEPALAVTVTALALGRAPPPIVAAPATPAPELAGALAAIVRAVAARAHADAAPAVLHAGPGAPMLLDLAAAGTALAANLLAANLLAANLTVLVGDEAFSALVVVDGARMPADREARGPLDPPPWGFSSAALASLGPTPLALRVVVASCLATVGELARLAPGDVLLTGLTGWMAASAEELRAHGPRGRVALVAPRGEVGLVAELSGPGRLVLSAERVAMPLVATDATREPPPRGGNARMDPKDTAAHAQTAPLPLGPHDVLADVPLVVRVELGAAELSASAWADTRPGDVIALGRGIGEPVVLRVSGTEVARGELVVIEGELGVRVLSRAGARALGDEVAS